MQPTTKLATLVTLFVTWLSISIRAHAADCGPNVHWSGSSATVLPSHGDDTAALQCVFTALSGVSGSQIKLVAGTYTTANLIVADFDGVFSGAGAGATFIRNGSVQVAPDFLDGDPSLSNPWPLLVSFIGGRFQVRDIEFDIRGQEPTTWTLPGFPVLHSLAVVAQVFGKVDARFVRVRITGERSDDPVFGYNLYNGIIFQGIDSASGNDKLTSASGSVAIENCSFHTMGSWAPLAGVKHGTLTATGNDVDDVFFAFDVASLQNTRVLYAGNRILPLPPDNRGALVTSFVGPLDGGSISLVANEVECSEQGVAVTMDFSNGARCSIVGNKVTAPDPAILLGPGTSHCLVAGNHGATVLDQGTNNIVVRSR
jgi:hypothetical protein